MALPRIFYDNRLADASAVASTTAAGFNVLNLSDWRNYTWWQPTALPATVTVDCGSAKAADYSLIYGHTLGSSGCTIETRGSTDNFVTSDVLIATKTPADDTPFVSIFSSVSYRYWRFKVTGSTTMPELAIAAIGARLEVPLQPDDGFDPLTRNVMGQANRSEAGNPLGNVIYFEEWRQTVAFTNISTTWVRNSWVPAWKSALRSQPFVFAWETDLFPTDLRLVKAANQFLSPHHYGSLCDLSVELYGPL